jgi:thiol-disulfide isomerase/thioredoxin
MKRLLTVAIVVGLIICLFVGCNPTTPAEGEGEGEGEEEVSRVVIVELFSQDNCASCAVVEPILEQLADEYERSEVVFLEERAYGPYSLNEIRDRYEWYLPSISDRGTPHILFNGLNQKIYGETTYVAIKSKINLELGRDAKISISATRSSDSTTTTISGTIQNISSSTLNNLVINGMSIRNLGQVGTKYLVMDIFIDDPTEVSVATLAPGEKSDFTFSLENINWEGYNMHGVVFIQTSSTKEILQAKYIE